MLDFIFESVVADNAEITANAFGGYSFSDKMDYLLGELSDKTKYPHDANILKEVQQIKDGYTAACDDIYTGSENIQTEIVTKVNWGGRIFTGLLYAAGIAALTYSAISLYNKIHDHYHPKYDEIPMSMVDLVRTADGDRYIKYDVVLDTTLKDGAYHAADLNAFQGERWNALYYTKSSEAGNPLVADFEVSGNNNRASDGYVAVHRFGEVVCYDLNKYNFSSSSATVFLSIGQSDNQKSDVTSVPDVIGAIFGTGFWLIAGGIGVIAGVGCTLGTQYLLKKKKEGGVESPENTEA
jgi:hypothetical protein